MNEHAVDRIELIELERVIFQDIEKGKTAFNAANGSQGFKTAGIIFSEREIKGETLDDNAVGRIPVFPIVFNLLPN